MAARGNVSWICKGFIQYNAHQNAYRCCSKISHRKLLRHPLSFKHVQRRWFNPRRSLKEGETTVREGSFRDLVKPFGFTVMMDWSIRHTAMVVSPLKALMSDQVINLQNMGISCVAVQPEHAREIGKDIADGKLSIVFISPESLSTQYWRTLFLSELKCKICLLACDEAHCISQWGEDFRPSYKEVLNMRSIIESPVLAVTGTCDEKVKQDIFQSLGLSSTDTHSVVIIPDRPNIYLDVRSSKETYEEELEWLLNHLAEKTTDAVKGIVYCRSVNTTAKLYNHFKFELKLKGICVELIDMYHKSIDDESQERIIHSFNQATSKLRILFSTIAFGMGVQIGDIKCIVHWGVPKTPLNYWQEVGRAGRDGQFAVAIMYAFKRSMTKNRTDESMIKLCKDVLENKTCIRYEILKAISVDSKIEGEEKVKCTGDCVGVCECQFCKCCSTCFVKCLCKRKVSDTGDRLGVDGLV